MEDEFRDYTNKISFFVRYNEFNYSLNQLKYLGKNKRIDSYHSIYGQARGMTISFIINIIFIIIICVESPNLIPYSNIRYIAYIIIFDCIMFVVFLIRTYRYYLSWIRNVYYQFYFLVETNSKQDHSTLYE